MEKKVFYEIEEKVLAAALQYLASKTFNEVHQLISALQQCKKVEDTEGK